MDTRSSPLPPRDRPPFDQADSATGVDTAALRPFPSPHRFSGIDLEEVERRLREGSPKSGARHVRLTDSRMIGPNEWTEWLWAMPALIVAAYFIWQYCGRPGL